MNCSNCAAPLPPKTDRCAYCHTLNDVDLRAVQGAMAGGASDRGCPRCRDTMGTLSLPAGGAAVVIERCERCLGLFFDPGELDRVLEATALAPRDDEVDHERLDTLIADRGRMEDVEYARCPICSTLMHRKTFGAKSGVVVDSCKGHGVWLDGGELARLVRWHAAGGTELARQREHEAALTAARPERPRIDPLTLRVPEMARGHHGDHWAADGDSLFLGVLAFLARIMTRTW